MSSYAKPKLLTFKADAAIPEGAVVKYGSDNKHVAKSTAATDKHVGIAQNAAVNAGDKVEVALPGGGAKALAGGSINGGDVLTADSSGNVVATTTDHDRVIAVALDGAASADLVSVHVVLFIY